LLYKFLSHPVRYDSLSTRAMCLMPVLLNKYQRVSNNLFKTHDRTFCYLLFIHSKNFFLKFSKSNLSVQLTRENESLSLR